ncbi:unnamed protein product, partial [marine sediment metagenome]
MGKTILVDIDGTVNNYPKCFLDWVELNTGQSYMTVVEMKEKIGSANYQNIKYKYRMSGVKRELPVYHSSIKVLSEFKNKGCQIWFYTTRPRIQKVMDDTVFWLNKYFMYNQLFFVDNKKDFLNKHMPTISLVID